MVMEEEIQMLFRLAMPEDWRNRMPSTPPPSSPPPLPKLSLLVNSDSAAATAAGGGGSGAGIGGASGISNLSLSPFSSTTVKTKSGGSGNFWSDVGLRSYAQMDFDLELSLGKKCGGKSSRKAFSSCGRAKKGRRGSQGPTDNVAAAAAVPKEKESSTSTSAEPRKSVVVKDNKEEAYDGDVEDYEDDICKVVPPNALGLINILRLTLDCPFSDVRKQAANVLFLLKEKGVATPYTLVIGPCTFINPVECPSIDVDRFASELGIDEVVEGGIEPLNYFQESTEFIDGGVDENVARQLELKKVGELSSTTSELLLNKKDLLAYLVLLLKSIRLKNRKEINLD